MVNRGILESKIKASGKKKTHLAQKCGISRVGFYNCLNNKTEFKPSHIAVLCKELGISSLREKETIFFV